MADYPDTLDPDTMQAPPSSTDAAPPAPSKPLSQWPLPDERTWPFAPRPGADQTPAQQQYPDTISLDEVVGHPKGVSVGSGLRQLFWPGQAGVEAAEQALNEKAADNTGNVMAAEMMKGVPALGHAVPWLERNVVPQSARASPEQLAGFEHENAALSTGLQAAGNIASTGPLYAAFPGLAGTMGIGAATSAADTAAAGGNLDDVVTNGAIGAAAGVIAHGLSGLGPKLAPTVQNIGSHLPGSVGRGAVAAGSAMEHGVPEWDQLTPGFKDKVSKIIATGTLGHTIWHGINHGFEWRHLAEVLAGLGAAAGASGHGGGMFGRLPSAAWNAAIRMPLNAVLSDKGPILTPIIKSGVNHLTRPDLEQTSTPSPPPQTITPQRRGGRARSSEADSAMQRTLKRARATRGRQAPRAPSSRRAG
jgi:hypothetical protein